MQNLHDFGLALKHAWCKETAYMDKDQTGQGFRKNPWKGQCCVTALLVQDYFGGDIWKCHVDDVSHFYNMIGDVKVDFTWNQFKDPKVVTIDKAYPRAYFDDDELLMKRYDILKRRFQEVNFGNSYVYGRPITGLSVRS